MAQADTRGDNYRWATEHLADFERYLAEQCRPHFDVVSADDSSKFMAPMWWCVGYVIQRGLEEKPPICPDDTETLIDRAMLLLELLTHSSHPIFPEIRQRFVLPMAKALEIDKSNETVNEQILKSVAFVVFSLRDGKTLTVPELTGPRVTTLKTREPAVEF